MSNYKRIKKFIRVPLWMSIIAVSLFLCASSVYYGYLRFEWGERKNIMAQCIGEVTAMDDNGIPAHALLLNNNTKLYLSFTSATCDEYNTKMSTINGPMLITGSILVDLLLPAGVLILLLVILTFGFTIVEDKVKSYIASGNHLKQYVSDDGGKTWKFDKYLDKKQCGVCYTHFDE